MEKLEVRNFGPIDKASIEIKDVNIFIGPTSSGKSAIAKLCTIFKDYTFINKSLDFNAFKEHLKKYNIHDYLTDSSFIRFESSTNIITISNRAINNKRKNNKFIRSYNEIRKLSRLSESKNTEEITPNVYTEAFSHLTILSKPIVENIQSLDYKEYSTFIKLMNETAYLDEHIDIERYKIYDLDKYLVEIKEEEKNRDDDDPDYLYQVIEELEFLFKNWISFFSSNLHELSAIQTPLYIPTERVFFSIVDENKFSFDNLNLRIPQTLIDFGVVIEDARRSKQKNILEFLNISYQFTNGKTIITDEKDRTFDLSGAASGIQTILPIHMAINYINNSRRYKNIHFTIEEPELNLYPSHQKKLLEYLIEKCTKHNNSLTITTHSPYIITSLNNAIQAQTAFTEKPDKEREINDILNKKYWIDYSKVSAYYMRNGIAENIMNIENKSIGANMIDDISDELAVAFDKLTDYIYL